MNTLTKLLFGSAILALGAVLIINAGQSAEKPSWVHEVHWQDKPEVSAKIEELLWNEVSPYRSEYETVNISASAEGKKLRLKVIAAIKESDRPDIYDFVYEDSNLIMTGYLLEAIPVQVRDDAISVALISSEMAAISIKPGIPTVRRILPKTSEKYYAPKTLLSVSWDGSSALIDPDVHKVVNVWNAAITQGQQR
ncbi:MAG: hypothetical protein KKG76_04340 [Euryarchaeota archaeon]|nr:hypothetical protein [Euryarchaeota archaeon]MBU4139922.1 hypothetical protein [Euryarchaeota archaeon]